MKSKRLIFGSVIFFVLSFYVVVNVLENNKKVTAVDFYTDNDSKTNVKYTTLAEIRESADDLLEGLKHGDYENLTAEDLHLTLSEADTVTDIALYTNKDFRNMEAKEIMEEEVRIIKALLGEDLKADYLVDSALFYETGNENVDFKTYEEAQTLLAVGEYKPEGLYILPHLAYLGWNRDEKDRRYAHVPYDFDYIVFMRGKMMELQGHGCEDPARAYEPVATYYMDDDNLDDVYQLINGTISVRDAIAFVEDYFNYHLPYETAENVDEKVRKVVVYEIVKGTFCMQFEIRRTYNGLVFAYGDLSSLGTEYLFGIPPYEMDNTKAIMVETNRVDQRTGSGNGMAVEPVGDVVEQVVSLESAIEKISRQIGKNSKYNIDLIEMIYREEKVYDEGMYRETKGEPCWLFQCTNQTDGKRTVFYVKLKNGDLNYYTFIPRPKLEEGETEKLE